MINGLSNSLNTNSAFDFHIDNIIATVINNIKVEQIDVNITIVAV